LDIARTGGGAASEYSDSGIVLAPCPKTMTDREKMHKANSGTFVSPSWRRENWNAAQFTLMNFC
jgi:hypothetical protein